VTRFRGGSEQFKGQL